MFNLATRADIQFPDVPPSCVEKWGDVQSRVVGNNKILFHCLYPSVYISSVEK